MKIIKMLAGAALLTVGSTLFAVGCGDPAGVTCSYDIAGAKSCSTINPKSGNDVSEDDLQKVCTGTTGKVVDSCPTDGLIGTCTYSDANYDYSQAVYGDAKNAKLYEMACKAEAGGGTWKAK